MSDTRNTTPAATLPVALTIDTVEALAADFNRCNVEGPAFTLDAGNVETLTTPGAQVILSFAKLLEAQGVALCITNARPEVTHVFEQLGLATQFSVWEA